MLNTLFERHLATGFSWGRCGSLAGAGDGLSALYRYRLRRSRQAPRFQFTPILLRMAVERQVPADDLAARIDPGLPEWLGLDPAPDILFALHVEHVGRAALVAGVVLHDPDHDQAGVILEDVAAVFGPITI